MVSIGNLYLIAYNGGCMAGWGYALLLALMALATGGELTGTWAAMGISVQAAQWAMALEIVHAAVGLVRSPLLTTFMQVMSRLNLVFFILLTIGAWNNESSFNALVQGTLISGAGKAVTALRQKSKAEDGESLAGLVDEILDGQKDAAAEAE